MKMKGLLRKILVMGIVALFLGVIGLAFFKMNMLAYASGAIYIRADGSVEGTAFIQSSDNVTYVFTADINDCDIICVQRSNIIVDGNGHVLNSSGIDAEVGIDVESVNNVTIQNVSIHNFPTGIYLYDAANNTISGNNVTNNHVGISINSCGNNTVSGNNVTGNNQRGIYLYSSANNNIISGNKVEGSPNGIGVEGSMNNFISGNNITSNNITSYTYDGIYLYSSSGNSISGNYIANNSRYGISLTYYCSNNTLNGNNITANNDVGIRLDGSSNNVISGNTVGNSPNEHICLLYSSNNNTISGNTLTNSTADVGIYVYACSLNSFFGNNITSNANSGIRIDSSSDSTISENNISENLNGIYLFYSSNITVSGNSITANNESGIVIDLSNNNTVNGNNIMTNKGYGVDFNSASNKFFHNNFINNTVQVRAPNYDNTWDNGYPSGGNYWSDYLTRYPNATEIDHTGIGDTAYEINANNTDHYPLMIPYETTPPTITILSPENKTYAVNASIPLAFTVDEFASWMGYSLDGQANVTITVNNTLPTLPDGWHYVTVYANDTFGNMGFATVYFTVDTTKPDITNVVQDPLTNVLPETVVKINATVTDATSRIKQVLLNCTFTNSTDTWYTVFSMTHLTGDIWNATIPPYPYGTNVTYVIIAEDNAGNTITTEQIYGYKYEYQVVPEFPLPTILLLLMLATLLIAVVVRKRALPPQNKINSNFPFSVS
jgi:parallel beta-helix repeat protein